MNLISSSGDIEALWMLEAIFFKYTLTQSHRDFVICSKCFINWKYELINERKVIGCDLNLHKNKLTF